MEKTILIVGFEETSKNQKVSSGKIATAVNNLRKEDFKIKGECFPIKIYDINRLILEKMYIYQPKIVIIIQSSSCKNIVMHRYAQNMVKGQFLDENVKQTAVIKAIPTTQLYENTLPIEEIYKELRDKKIPVEINYKPNTHIENFTLFYLEYFLMQNDINIPVGLVEFPSSVYNLVDLIKILDLIISETITHTNPSYYELGR